MCYDLKSSILGAALAIVFSILAFYVLRNRYGQNLSAWVILVFGMFIAGVQVSEAFIWANMGNQETCLGPTILGYIGTIALPFSILIPLIVYSYFRRDWKRIVMALGLSVFYLFGLLLPESNIPKVCVVVSPDDHLTQPYWKGKTKYFTFG